MIYSVVGAKCWIERIRNAQDADGALAFAKSQLEDTAGSIRKLGVSESKVV